jgi:hypothetical protein
MLSGELVKMSAATKKKLLLLPELVPGPLWGRSAHKMLGNRAIWKKQIRGDALTRASNRCSFCKSDEGRLICHDKWQYNDKQSIATLIGFEIHCSACDSVTHVGRAFMGASNEEREEVLRFVILHLAQVNKCKPEMAQKILMAAMDQWIKRSNMKWTIEVAATLVEQYPELVALPEFVPPAPRF